MREAVGTLKISNVCVVQPIDGFTGRTILAKDFVVEAEGERPAVRKKDGFFVFSRIAAGSRTGIGRTGSAKSGAGKAGADGMSTEGAYADGVRRNVEHLTVRLRGRGYQERTVQIPISGNGGQDMVHTVFLNPDENYAFPPGTVFMKGTLPADSCLRAALITKTGSLKLSEDYHAYSELIGLYGGKNMADGSVLYMDKGTYVAAFGEKGAGLGGQEADGCFLVLRKRQRIKAGRYYLQEPLAFNFEKRTARLYPARQHITGERAEAYLFAFRMENGAEKAEAEIREGRQKCHVEQDRKEERKREEKKREEQRQEEQQNQIEEQKREEEQSHKEQQESREGTIWCRLETPGEIRECLIAVKSGEEKRVDFGAF